MWRLSLSVGRVVRDVYYSATVSTIIRITSKHLCIAGPYALSHDLARKNAKFTVKLSALSRHVDVHFSTYTCVHVHELPTT